MGAFLLLLRVLLLLAIVFRPDPFDSAAAAAAVCWRVGMANALIYASREPASQGLDSGSLVVLSYTDAHVLDCLAAASAPGMLSVVDSLSSS